MDERASHPPAAAEPPSSRCSTTAAVAEGRGVSVWMERQAAYSVVRLLISRHGAAVTLSDVWERCLCDDLPCRAVDGNPRRRLCRRVLAGALQLLLDDVAEEGPRRRDQAAGNGPCDGGGRWHCVVVSAKVIGGHNAAGTAAGLSSTEAFRLQFTAHRVRDLALDFANDDLVLAAAVQTPPSSSLSASAEGDLRWPQPPHEGGPPSSSQQPDPPEVMATRLLWRRQLAMVRERYST